MMTRWGVFFLLPLAVLAQPRYARGPRLNAEVAKELNLSDAQTREMNQVNQDFRQRLFQDRDQVNKAEAAVEAVFNEDPVDSAKGAEAINRLAAARSELTKATSEWDLKLRMILTAQQWQQLKQRQRGRWPGAPAGPRRHGRSGVITPNGANPQK